MIEEAVCVGVDFAKSTLDVAVTDSKGARQFANDDGGISQAVRYIAGVKPVGITLEAAGNLEILLAAALQAGRLPVAVINPRQVRDFAQALRPISSGWSRLSPRSQRRFGSSHQA